MSTYPNVPVVAWEVPRPLYLTCASLYPEERLMMFPQMKAIRLWIYLKMILDTSLWSGTNCKRCTVTRDIHTKRSKDWTWITIQSFPGTTHNLRDKLQEGWEGWEWRGVTSVKGEHERGTPGLPLQPFSWDVPNKVPAHPVCTEPHPGLKKKVLRDICKKGGKGNCRYAALRKWFRDEHNEHSSSEWSPNYIV